MLSMVLFPMTLPGSTNSTRLNLAARCQSASMETSIPGAIAPPRYSPSLETAAKVVAVPKSTTTQGPPYISYAATAPTIRSEPTSRGLLVSTGIPVLTPGPTVNDSASRNAPAILWYSVLRLGTTEETIMAFTDDTSNPSRRSNPPSAQLSHPQCDETP